MINYKRCDYSVSDDIVSLSKKNNCFQRYSLINQIRDYYFANKFEFDKALSSFDTSTHQFTAKFLVEPSLFGEQIAGVFIAHSVFNGGELDNMKITAGTSVIRTSLFEYKILKNSDTWTICCLQVTALA